MTTDHPHIYQKGKLIKLKSLDNSSIERRFHFFSTTLSLKSVISATNNLNQMVARNWLKLTKIMIYLGLTKAKNIKDYKNTVTFNKVQTDLNFKPGGNEHNIEHIKNLFIDLKNHLTELSNKISQLENKVKPVFTEERFNEFERKFDEVNNKLKSMIS